MSGTSEKRGKWERLESYQAIWSDPRVKSKLRVIEGDPLFGKTRLTLQIAYEWCICAQGSNLEQVEILIHLNLGKLMGITSIYESIKRLLLPSDFNIDINMIKHILNDTPSLVFVLDSYDEYIGSEPTAEPHGDVLAILKEDILAHSEVILATRLPCNQEHFSTPKKTIRLTGFDKFKQNQYIHNDIKNTGLMEIIKESLLENPVIEGFCQVPFVLAIYTRITQENEALKQFNTITRFMQKVILCFHEHLKQKLYNQHITNVTDHHSLNELAFKSLTGYDGHCWSKEQLVEVLGRDCLEHYLRIGILRELDVRPPHHQTTGTDSSPTIRQVTFYHNLFVLWYAAHYFVDFMVSKERDVEQPTEINISESLDDLNRSDFQHFYQFACGINPKVAYQVVHYLQGFEGSEAFKKLCLLEQSNEIHRDVDIIKELVSSKDIHLAGADTRSLQRNMLHILAIASHYKVK